MHRENIEAAKREVLRLIGFTDQVLAEHLAASELVRESDLSQIRHLDRTKANDWRRALATEAQKVSNLEAVIAVVGAAKSGKSTTINAIVGAEILPNRAKPMTTFPTLVRHTPNRVEPLLRFPLARQFRDLARAVRRRLEERVNEKPLREWFPDDEEFTAANQVLNGDFDRMPDVYSGHEAIRSCLEWVNDLCRLAGTSPVKEPLPDFQGPDGVKLPEIEIQFHHIGDSAESAGRLTILDSPGPNEYGQEDRLREIVREQLGQASAVMLVCDATQEKTVAATELQKLVHDFLAQLQSRLFVFVNKIDQLMSKDPRIDGIPEAYSRGILENALPAERIFPVAARNAFLANWALRELEVNGRLPDPAVVGTTRDFAGLGLGALWKETVQDSEVVRRSALAMWEDSQFDEPLRQVVLAAADNAALISLQGAAAKLFKYNTALDGFLRMRESVGTHDIVAIQEQIDGLQSDIRDVSAAQSQVLQFVAELVQEFNQFLSALYGDIVRDVEFLLGHYFKAGRLARGADIDAERATRRNTFTAWLRQTLLQLGDDLATVFRYPPQREPEPEEEPTTSFSGTLTSDREFRGAHAQAEAQKLANTVTTGIRRIFELAHTEASAQIDHASQQLAGRVRQEIEQRMTEILAKAQERLSRAFDITLEAPKIEFRTELMALTEPSTEAVSSRREAYTYYVERAGYFAAAKRWVADLFDEKWGYDEVQGARDVWTVGATAMRDRALRQLGAFEQSVRAQAEAFVRTVLLTAIDRHFDDLREYLEAFRGDLLDALADKSLDAERLQNLQEQIRRLRVTVDDLLLDSRSVAESLQAV